jgi:hypothetical protein
MGIYIGTMASVPSSVQPLAAGCFTECQAAEEDLATKHLDEGGAWRPSTRKPPRGCRRSLSDNASASWKSLADADANFASHEQVGHGYGVFAAASRQAGDATEEMLSAVREHVFGNKLPDVSKLVREALVQYLVGHVALLVVGCPFLLHR